MKKEWDDESLAIEISRNPQLHMQLQAQIAQMIAQAKGGGQGGQNPQLTEGEGGAGNTAGETLPMSTAGSGRQAATPRAV